MASLMDFIVLRIRYVAFGFESLSAQCSDRVGLDTLKAKFIKLFYADVRQSFQESADAKQGDATSSKPKPPPVLHALAGADLLLPTTEWSETWALLLSKHCSVEKIFALSQHLGFECQELKSKFSYTGGNVF